MGLVSKALRNSARGQTCTLQSPFCNYDTATTVLAHLPSDVKGMGNKSDDWHACFACSACHEALDRHQLGEGFMFRALQRTHKIWVEMGLISVAGVKDRKPKRSTKSLPPRSFSAKGQLWRPHIGADTDDRD